MVESSVPRRAVPLPRELREPLQRAMAPLRQLSSETSTAADGTRWRAGYGTRRAVIDQALASPKFVRRVRAWRRRWGVPTRPSAADIAHAGRLAGLMEARAVVAKFRAAATTACATQHLVVDAHALAFNLCDAVRRSLRHEAELRGIAHEFRLVDTLWRWLLIYVYTGVDDVTSVPRDFAEGGGLTVGVDAQGRRYAEFRIEIDAPGGVDPIVRRVREEIGFLRRTPERGGGTRTHLVGEIDKVLRSLDRRLRRTRQVRLAKEWDRLARREYVEKFGKPIAQTTFTKRVNAAIRERKIHLPSRCRTPRIGPTGPIR